MTSLAQNVLSIDDLWAVEQWAERLRTQYEQLSPLGFDHLNTNMNLDGWPVARPAWVVDLEVSLGGYMEVDVVMTGREHEPGAYSAWVTQTFNIDLSDHPEDGIRTKCYPADVLHSASDDALTAEGARHLATALLAAADELESILAQEGAAK